MCKRQLTDFISASLLRFASGSEELPQELRLPTRRVQQHQLVYQALQGQMGGKLHALALQTGVPDAA